MSVTSLLRSQIKRFEVTCVYSPPDAIVDIVLVHGLNGHPEKTWSTKNGVFWPTDLLPASLKGAKARILVYGYNADVYAFGGDRSASSDMIHQHAQTLVSGLSLERESEDCGENAILWVAHSLGGILVKRALELSNDLTSKSSDPSRSIYVSTYGIIFLGTPHTGAEPAKWAMLLQGLADALIPKKVMDTEPHLVQTLKSNNEVLQNINLHFLDIYQRFEIDMVHEAVKTDMKGLKAFVVDQASASPQLPGVRYYGIEASHSTMCKFESKSSPGYLNVSTQIRKWVLDSPPVIQSRWVAERKARQQARENEARELLGIYGDPVARPTPGSSTNTPELSNSAIISTSVIQSVASIEPEKPSDTYFIKPQGFRPNSLFFGRETELADMHKMLFDKKRRAEGTSAVLLQCLPGGGKSCLARQYVYKHLDDFPGGVFWVQAKSQAQLAAGFWDIACKVALKPSNNSNVTAPPKDPQQFISVVIEWFNSSHDWLLVLDGIQFDHSEALRRFIPDSKNSSLIYTSTERGVVGDYHFMNPQVIRVPLLSAREAQDLFIAELDKKNATQDELNIALDLVRRMGFLPLVIHTVAQQLKATREPLAKFARTYATGPNLRDLDTYNAVVQQLRVSEAFEALNLINILCFFSQHIPVEMISLGLKAPLGVQVKAYERATGRTLNNTMKILNRFALIDRNEDQMQSSQSSRESREFLSDDVDLIKLHSVVQDFFIDSLRADGLLPEWLQRAVNLFRSSYEKANRRISCKTNAGLVGDYRSYEIHGLRLLDHLSRHEKKIPTLSRVREVLEPCLEALKEEIERRTKESSYEIVQGKPEVYQTSIFDRTSSSSDTGPETPRSLDRINAYTWGTEGSKGPFESPVSLTHDGVLGLIRNDLSKGPLPPPRIEDPGYDSDRDEAESMTAQPSQRTPRLDGLASLDRDWQMVYGRRDRQRPPPLDLHRTIKGMERKRYHDSVGAWRAVNTPAADPRVSLELAEAFIPKTTPRVPSRGRISGQSQAEVALSQINKNSPPPIRGGGKIIVQDRRRSPQPRRAFTDHPMAGNATYASAEVGGTASTVTKMDIPQDWSASGPSLGACPATPAINSLHRFPHSMDESMSPPSSRLRDPQSPSSGNRPPYPFSETYLFPMRGQDSPEDPSMGGGMPIYPRQVGSLPTEYYAADSLPHRRGLPHDYPDWNSGDYDPNMRSFMASTNRETLHRLYGRNNYLSTSERDVGDANVHREFGYSSQPMSRDPSGGSARGARRSSLAESEPPPQMPDFSPHVTLTSYEVYENMRERGKNGPRRKSPRLDVANTAYAEEGAGWPGPPDRSKSENIVPLRPPVTFNPKAPVFFPRTQSQPPGPFRNTPSPSLPEPKTSPPYPEYWPQQHLQQASSGSGGVRIGGRMILFGDSPEIVDVDLARQRVDKQRADLRGLAGHTPRGESLPNRNERHGHEDQGPRLARISPNANVPSPVRAVSDFEAAGRDRPPEGRKRGLSSPERAAGFKFMPTSEI